MPIVAFCCHVYGWTSKECLDLPLKSLFAFYREGAKIQAREYKELLSIQAVSVLKNEYFHLMMDRYNAILFPDSKKLPPKPSGAVVEAGTPESHELMRGLAISMRKSLGYG